MKLWEEIFRAGEIYSNKEKDSPVWKQLKRKRNPTHEALTPQHRKVLKVLKAIGMPFTLEKDVSASGYGWDGSLAYFKGFKVGDAMHDMAHYQCSSTRLRKLPEFGLGSGFCTEDYDGADSNHRRNEEKTQLEEEYASLLGILWERELGYNFAATLDLHSWPTGRNSKKNFFKIMRGLSKRGLIDENARPTTKLNVRPV